MGRLVEVESVRRVHPGDGRVDMVARMRDRAAIRIGEDDIEALAVPAAPRGGVEKIGGANRRCTTGKEAGTLSLAVATVGRPGPAGYDGVVPVASLHDIGVDAVAFGPLIDLVFVGKSQNIVCRRLWRAEVVTAIVGEMKRSRVVP